MTPRLESRVAAVARRMHLQAALDALPLSALLGAALAAVGLGVGALGADPAARMLFAASLLVPLVHVLLSGVRPASRLLAARHLDAALGERDLIASAHSFAALPSERRTPFMQACMRSAGRRVESVRPAEALPLHLPAGLGKGLAAVALVALVGQLELPEPAPPPAPPHPQRPRLLHAEDLAAFTEVVEPIARDDALSPEAREAAREINTLLEALEDRALQEADALRELRRLQLELERRLGERDEAALREALAELGRTLGEQTPLKDLSDAFRNGSAERASRELEALAADLQREGLERAAQRRLKKGLDRAARRPEDDAEARLERKRRELERLLKKKRKQAGAQAQRQERLLKKKRRELDQLRREHEARRNARRQLDQLRRHMDGASQRLGAGQQAGAGGELERAARSLEQAARSQRSREELRRMQQQLEQLRQLLAKQKQRGGRDGQASGGGKAQRLSLGRFGQAARGLEPGSDGERRGSQGEGDEAGRQRMLVPGGSGEGQRLLMPGGGDESRRQAMMAEGQIGSHAGEGGRSRSAASPSELDGTRVDTRLTGQKGKGPSRSEVIREAGSRGFVNQPYRKVYGEYERHAESVLERDEVPGGYRFYVRRYFQLIRPREGQHE
ncbi:MAG: hypothetical protein PVI30_00020 [Myxococcales bacterium]|jgi:hypothetical protein